MDNQQMLGVFFLIVVVFVLGKLIGKEMEKERRAKEDARFRARQEGEQIDETQRDWWLRH